MGRDQESLERSCGGTPPHPSHGILSSHIPESPPEGLDPNKPHGEESRRFPISHLRGAGKTCSRKTPTGKEMDLERALLAEQETLPTFLPGSWFHSKCSSLQPRSMFHVPILGCPRDKSSEAKPGLGVTWPKGGFGKRLRLRAWDFSFHKL